MRRAIPTWAVVCALSTGAAASAQTRVVEESPPPALAPTVAAANAGVMRGGKGPYRAVMVSDATLPTHTLYRPEKLGAVKGKIPVVAWGNGACTNIGNRFRYFLTEVASHGYLVIATGPAGPSTVEWKVDLNAGDPRPPTARPAQSFAAQLTDAIDWAIAENGRKGSPYFGRLDTRAIAVMGQSCGGLQAISAAADKRVRTAVVWNSGTFPDGTPPLSGTGDANKASLKRLHTPVAWISGDESDIAYKNADTDFDAVTGIPAMRAWLKGTGHSEVYRQPMGGAFAPVAAAWLDWQLKGSAAGRGMFVGTGCGLCADPKWVVKWKGQK